jgi:hypothetical protein
MTQPALVDYLDEEDGDPDEDELEASDGRASSAA